MCLKAGGMLPTYKLAKICRKMETSLLIQKKISLGAAPNFMIIDDKDDEDVNIED